MFLLVLWYYFYVKGIKINIVKMRTDVKIIMGIRLTTLSLFSKKLFLLMPFIILLPNVFYSMQHLTLENYCTFFKDKPIYNTLEQIKNTPIDANTYHTQKEVHLILLKIFFGQLTDIINKTINKQDTWFLFLSPDVTLAIPWAKYLTYYYQHDVGFTTFFVDTINNLFNSIENEQDKQNAKICAFFSINRYTDYTDDIFVLWDEQTAKAFFYVPNTLNQQSSLNTYADWYNILPEIPNSENNNPPETTDLTNRIKKVSYFYCTLEDNPFFTYGRLSEHLLVITEHNSYQNRQITEIPNNPLAHNTNPINQNNTDYVKTYCKYVIPIAIILILAAYQAKKLLI